MFANFLYLCAIALASPMIAYRAIRHGRYRRGLRQKFLGLSPSKAQEIRGEATQCLWIHAVSVGEVNLLRGIVNRLLESDPDLAIAISTSTDTGYDVAVKQFGTTQVFFCPLDFTWAVKRTLRNLRPDRLVLAELELWPNLIYSAKRLETPVYVINGRLSDRSAARYQKFSRFTRGLFTSLDWVGCQDQTCADNFLACGTPIKNVSITGSLKFDDAPESRDTTEVMSRLAWAGVDAWHRVWMFGSTQAGEEELALQAFLRLREEHPELRMILVPRHRERFEAVADLIRSRGLRVHKRSEDVSLNDKRWDSDVVVLVDTIGELKHWWGVCHIATVGGSFGDRGGQNMLEPAGYGCAVSFGPNTRNFSHIADRLIAAGGAIRVQDREQLTQFVSRCLTNIPAADALGIAAQEMIRQHRGATDRTVDRILDSFPRAQTIKRAAA